MKKLCVLALVVLLSGLSVAQEDGAFGITFGGSYLMGRLADTNNHGFEFGIISKVPIAEQGPVKTLVTGISYIRLPWSDKIVDPERTGHVISTYISAMAGNATGVNVFGGPSMNFGLFDQGYLGLELGAGYGIDMGRTVDVSLSYTAFNGINKLKNWDDEDALDLIRFNITMTL